MRFIEVIIVAVVRESSAMILMLLISVCMKKITILRIVIRMSIF